MSSTAADFHRFHFDTGKVGIRQGRAIEIGATEIALGKRSIAQIGYRQIRHHQDGLIEAAGAHHGARHHGSREIGAAKIAFTDLDPREVGPPAVTPLRFNPCRMRINHFSDFWPMAIHDTGENGTIEVAIRQVDIIHDGTE